MSGRRAAVFICDRCGQPGQYAGTVQWGDVSLEQTVQNARFALCFPCMGRALRIRQRAERLDSSKKTLVKREGEGQ